MWPTSWTVRAEFLSSVFTLITPWLSPPMDNMALAGSGAPRTPGLQRQQKRKWRDQTGSKEILHRLHVFECFRLSQQTGKGWWKSGSWYINRSLSLSLSSWVIYWSIMPGTNKGHAWSCQNQKSLFCSLPLCYKSGGPTHVICRKVHSLRLSAFRVSKKMSHLRIATVRASGEVAQGQITSGFRPWDWKTFRKASQDDTDPAGKQKTRVLARKARHG